jgi:hypothetical protein
VTWTTHTLFGISTLWLLAPLPPEVPGYDFGTLAACAALGALLPDLDASEPKIKHLKLLGTQFKPFLLPAQSYIEAINTVACSIPYAAWAWSAPARCRWRSGSDGRRWRPDAGLRQHLVADYATKSGLRLRYPNTKRYHLLPLG